MPHVCLDGGGVLLLFVIDWMLLGLLQNYRLVYREKYNKYAYTNANCDMYPFMMCFWYRHMYNTYQNGNEWNDN